MIMMCRSNRDRISTARCRFASSSLMGMIMMSNTVSLDGNRLPLWPHWEEEKYEIKVVGIGIRRKNLCVRECGNEYS